MPGCGRLWQRSAPPFALAAIAGLWWMTSNSTRSATAFLDDRSEYLAVAASSGRGLEEVIWMFDTRTEELIVVAWDRSAGMMMPLGLRNVSADLDAAAGGR
jgi:hypothetical protein